MASAWEQAAEIQPVNQRLRQLQMSMAVGESLHARHLSTFTEEMTLRIASPVFSRIRVPTPDLDPAGTHADGDDGRNVAAGAGHAHGDAADRQAARTADAAGSPRRASRRSLETTWVARLNLEQRDCRACPADDRAGDACRRCRRWTASSTRSGTPAS